MATLYIGKSLSDDDQLWRYVPIEGLIGLLDAQALYFSPLTSFQHTDPFEGYMPPAGMEALASIAHDSQKRILADIDRLESYIGPGKGESQIAQMRADAKTHTLQMRDSFKKITQCLTVNCWHRNPHESEAMWGLYSRSGAAIRTSVASIRKSLTKNEQAHVVQMGAIKYLDFGDKALKPGDCVTADGHLMGMIKRMAYAHENEVRMYISGDIDPRNVSAAEPKPNSLNVDVDVLIESLVISPFASPLMRSSIRAIAKRYGIEDSKVVDSPLLADCEYLFSSYDA